MMHIYRMGRPIPFPTMDDLATFTYDLAAQVHELRHSSLRGTVTTVADCSADACRTAAALVNPLYACPNPGHGPGYRPDKFTCPDCGGSWIYEQRGTRA